MRSQDHVLQEPVSMQKYGMRKWRNLRRRNQKRDGNREQVHLPARTNRLFIFLLTHLAYWKGCKHPLISLANQFFS